MSVSSDFWAPSEGRGSSALRLAQSLRRSSHASSPTTSNRNMSVVEREKSRRSSLASLPLRLTKSRKVPSVAEVVPEVVSDSNQSRLGELFLILPNEIQIEITSFLSVQDVFNLRRSSKAINSFLNTSASAISRSILTQTELGEDRLYLQILYPQPLQLKNLDYFLQMLHRNAIVEKIIAALVDFIQVDIYLIKTGPRAKQFQPYREKLTIKLKKPAFIVMHHLEQSRHLHLAPEAQGGYPIKKLTRNLVNTYPSETAVTTYQFYRLMMAALRQRLRSPTYAGSLERAVRGWNHDPATDKELTALQVFGGVEQILRVLSIKSYGARLEALRGFLGTLHQPPDTNASVASNAIRELDVPIGQITWTSWPTVPELHDILENPLHDRINEENLAEDQPHFTNAFKWIADLTTPKFGENGFAARLDEQTE